MGIAKIFSALSFLILCAACSAVPPVSERDLPSDAARFSVVFDVINQKILGDALLEGRGDISGFNLEKYRDRLRKMRSKRPAELRGDLKEYEVQELKAYPKTFVFCVYSKKNGIAMCDDARCSGVERKAASKDHSLIGAWGKELPLQKCPDF